jgi:hypothetical protein
VTSDITQPTHGGSGWTRSWAGWGGQTSRRRKGSRAENPLWLVRPTSHLLFPLTRHGERTHLADQPNFALLLQDFGRRGGRAGGRGGKGAKTFQKEKELGIGAFSSLGPANSFG